MFKKVSLTLLIFSIVIVAMFEISFAEDNNTLRLAGPIGESKVLSVYDPPFIQIGNAYTQWMLIYDTLVGNNSDLIPDHPRLAKDWKISEDGLVWTFKLREDVKFHDGEKFTADDVKATIELQIHPDVKQLKIHPLFYDPFITLKGYSEYQEGKSDHVTGIEIVDDYTIKFTHEKKNGMFLLGMGVTSIMPEHKIKDLEPANLDKEDYFKHPIGTGAYELTEIKEGEYYRFEANEDYFRGAPKIDNVIIRQIDPSLAIANNETDFYSTYLLNPIKEAENNANYNIAFRSPMRQQYFKFSITAPPFNDIYFRRALIYALDIDAIIESFFGNHATELATIVCPGFWQNDTLALYPYNPKKAKESIEKSNYDGKELELLYYYDDEVVKDMMTTIQYYWSQVGINVQSRYVDAATYNAMVYGDQKDKFIGKGIVYSASAYSDPSFLTMFRSDNSINFLGWSSKQYDDFIDKGLTSVEVEERKKYYDKAQSILYRNLAPYSACFAGYS